MLTRSLKNQIYKMIPTLYQVSGQTITVPIRYANQWEVDVWPCIVLEYTKLTGNVFTPLDKTRLTTNEKTDNIKYVAGTHIYTLSMTKCKDIVEVIGYYTGLIHTFVKGIDYKLTGDTIEWITGDKPDGDTIFDITFTSSWIRTVVGGEKYDNLSINVYTKDYGVVKDGTFINGVLLADEIAGQLHKFFEFEAENSIDLVMVTQQDITNLDDLTPGEYQRRRQFDVHMRHLESHETQLPNIDEVEEPEVTVYET